MYEQAIKNKRRMPLYFRVGMAVFLLFAFSVGVVGYFAEVKQQHVVYNYNLKFAERILHYFAASSKIPLLADDTLRLSSVVKDTAAIEGISSAFIVDRNNSIQAHSNHELQGQQFTPFAGRIIVASDKSIRIVDYVDSSGQRMVDLSTAVIYNEKSLAMVHLVMQRSFAEQAILALQKSILQAVLVPALCVLLVLFCAAFWYLHKREQQIRRFIEATRQFAMGNLQHRIKNIGNNELGDLGLSLHAMSEKLSAQQGRAKAQLEQYMKFTSMNKILENPVSQGEAYAVRRQVAVVFVGVKGFGSYAGTEKPEEVVLSLNKYISIVTRVISKHGGYVDKIIGDAVVSIFGVSLYRENHTSRAVSAAIDLQQALSFGDAQESRLLSNVCVGVSSGIVLSGNIGSHSKVEYSSIGESIKEAYWLIGMGNPGDIILGEGIYEQLQDKVRVEPLPVQKAPGTTDTIKSYRFLALKEGKYSA